MLRKTLTILSLIGLLFGVFVMPQAMALVGLVLGLLGKLLDEKQLKEKE